MQAHNKGRDVLMVFEEDVGAALATACGLDCDSDAVHLARAAQIVRHQMCREAKPFNGFQERCQEESVPSLLLGLMSMVLESPSIKDQMADTTPAALAVAHILMFNSIKHKRTRGTSSISVRHNIAQETPVPTYNGMLLHAHTCKRVLLDRLSYLGISISYDHVLQLSTQMGKSVCQQFHREQVVCPPTMCGEVFTTAAIENIDHNPSSTTAKESFHGTGIFSIPLLLVKELIEALSLLKDLWMQALRTLATCHTTTLMCPPVTTSTKHSTGPTTRLTSLD